MRALRTAIAQQVSGCAIPLDKRDELWSIVTYEIAMNYSLEGLRYGYNEAKKNSNKGATAEQLRELGYGEDEIAQERKKGTLDG